MPADPIQGQFDFEDLAGQQRRQNTRSTRRRNIERLEIPPRPAGYQGKRCSPAACTAVLLCLDDHQREREAWRMKASTIAEKTGYRDRCTVQRAISYLAELGFLTVTRTGRSSLLAIDHAAIAAALEQPAPTSDEACAHIRTGQRPHQMRPAPTSTLPRALPETLPPTLGQEVAGDFWQELGRQLVAAGAYAATVAQLVDRLPRQVSEAEAAAVLAHYQASPGAWGPGALVARLRSHLPGMAPADGWPPPAAAYVREKAATAAQQAKQAKARQEATEAAQQAEADQLGAALEAEHGQALDQLPLEQARDLAHQVLGDFLARRWLADRRHSVLRPKMLQSLAESGADCIDKQPARH